MTPISSPSLTSGTERNASYVSSCSELKRLKRESRGSVLAQGNHGVVYGDPTRDALAHLHPDVADFRVVRQLRSAQNNFIRGVIDQIYQTRV